MKQTTRVLSLLMALLLAFSLTAAAANALTLNSATYNGADLEGATVPAGSDITLVFSDNVTDENVLANNIGKIKVKNEAGEDVTASPSVGADENTFIVTLGSDLAKGSYTLTVGKELTAKNGSKLDKKAEFHFTVKGSGSGDGTGGGNNPLEIEFVKVGDAELQNAELNGDELILIRFTRGMTEKAEANAALICVTDADGKAADYTVISPANKDEKNDVKVQLNGLKGGKYTLTIGKDVEANNGNKLGEDAKYSFTIKGEEKKEDTSVLGRVKQFCFNVCDKMVTFAIDLVRKLNLSVPSWMYSLKEQIARAFA